MLIPVLENISNGLKNENLGGQTMSAKEKIAYLKGLLAGLNMKDETAAKAFSSVTEALEALADEIEEHAALIEEDRKSVV